MMVLIFQCDSSYVCLKVQEFRLKVQTGLRPNQIETEFFYDMLLQIC